jgi:hypothetical protein
MRVVIRGCWALMADEREDPDFDMMVNMMDISTNQWNCEKKR